MAEQSSAETIQQNGAPATVGERRRSMRWAKLVRLATAVCGLFLIAVAVFLLWLWGAEREALPRMDGSLRHPLCRMCLGRELSPSSICWN